MKYKIIIISLLVCTGSFAQKLKEGKTTTSLASVFLQFDDRQFFRPFLPVLQPTAVDSVEITIGNPFASFFDDVVYFNPGDAIDTSSKSANNRFIISSLRYYQNTTDWYININPINSTPSIIIQSDKLSTLDIKNYFKPFYLKKNEVTNSEYREFVNDMMTARKDAAPSNVSYLLKNIEGKDRSVLIYPDTTTWIKDFGQGYIEPMRKMYWWHPAYDNYPVVGISWYQAMAFCSWKTDILNSQLKKAGIDITVEVSLPHAYEWEYAINKYRDANLSDYSWITDLMLNFENNQHELNRYFLQRTQYDGNYTVDGTMFTHIANMPVEKPKKEEWQTAYKLMQPNVTTDGIISMGDNVSEWLLEDYATGWAPVYDYRKKMTEAFELTSYTSDRFQPQADYREFYAKYFKELKEEYFINRETLRMYGSEMVYKGTFEERTEAFRLAAENLKEYYNEEVPAIRSIEKYYASKLNGGKLVCGGNWYDERFSIKGGVNLEGMYAKTFADPEMSYSTLGFRYVIRIVEPVKR